MQRMVVAFVDSSHIKRSLLSSLDGNTVEAFVVRISRR